MVSQGRRLIEGLPKEDSGAESFSCSTVNSGDSQSLFGRTSKEDNTINSQFTEGSLEDDSHCDENHGCFNKDGLSTEAESSIDNENDMASENCDIPLFVAPKGNKPSDSQGISEDISNMITHHQGLNSIVIGIDDGGLESFQLSKEQSFHEEKASHPQVQLKITSADNNVIQDGNECPNDNILPGEGGAEEGESSQARCVPDRIEVNTSCDNVYMAPSGGTLESVHENGQEISCPNSVSSTGIIYTNVHSEDPIVVSTNLQRTGKTQHLTLGRDSQLLLSGVQTIPEQLPLILTEGDAEEQESLTVMTGAEHLQAVSTQAVLGGNPGSAAGGLMVFSSNDITPTGQLIPISGTNLLVLQSLDAQGQVIHPNSVIVAGQPQILPKPAEQTSHGKGSGKQYHCPHSGCTKIAPTSSKLKLHMLTHTGERPHKCPSEGCEWAFTTAYKLRRHIRGHTGERPFVCDFNDCGKCFTTTYNLKTHQKAHIREQDNVCSYQDCGQTFSTLHKLKVHEKKHQLENQLHTCTMAGCGKQFKSLSNYNAHFKTHNGERPHACTFEGCGKRFTKASKLKLHVRTHTGERPFVCEEEGCDWSFTSAYKLKRHMRKHTGERPFNCQFSGCGKSFTRASHMRTHALSHTGQKPFICPLADCLKGFTAASSLNIHMRKHRGDKPFKCDVEGCDKAYTTGANLRLHQKRHEDKALNQDEAMEKDDEVGNDHARPVRYVEIGGVNSVVETDSHPVPSTPYSVMHTFTGEEFATEDVASLTVVQFSSEETFPPQTPASTIDSSSGICFQFSSNDSFANPSPRNAGSSISGLSFSAGPPLASPGAHYGQSNIGEEDEASEDIGNNSHDGQFLDKCSRNESPDNTTTVTAGNFIVREQTARTGRGLSAGDKDDEDLTLPTMVVFTPSNVPSASPIRPTNDVEARAPEETRTSESNIGHLTLRRRCENSAIDQFAPPAIIFQGEEVKSQDNDVKMSYSPADEHTNIKDPVTSSSLLTNQCRTPARSNNLATLPVSNLNLNLSSLSDEIDKSPGSPFISDVDHSLDHESTINLQDLRKETISRWRKGGMARRWIL